MKRMLIIGNNPIGTVNNNGKTVLSFLRKYNFDNIYQVYFQNVIPEDDLCSVFFRITDHNILRSYINHEKCGEIVKPSTIESNKKEKIRNFGYFIRFARELIWKNKGWQNNDFINFIDAIKPEIVFFIGGDSCFAYDICQYVVRRTNAELILFLTDDNILERPEISPFFWIRRSMIEKRIQSILPIVKLFITISESMHDCYLKRFGYESMVGANHIENKQILENKKNKSSEFIFSYVGSLHHKRWETLISVGKAISQYNVKVPVNRQAKLLIYSQHMPSKRIIHKIEKTTAATFRGSLQANEVPRVLEDADVLVHVESFRMKEMYATKLSLSTKIPEYLSYQKAIFAVGPKEIASMQFLSDVAFCVTQKNEVNDKSIAGVIGLIDNKIQISISKQKYQQYLTKNERISESISVLGNEK